MKQKLHRMVVSGILFVFSLGYGALEEDPFNQPRRIIQPRHEAGREREGKAFPFTQKMFGSRISTEQVRDAVVRMIQYSPGFSRKTNPNLISDWESVYLFFPENVRQASRSFYLEKGAPRLDIQGEAGEGLYVQVQLQIGSGQDPDHCLGSVNIRKGIFYSVSHIMYCLQQSYQTKDHNTKGVKQNRTTIWSDANVL